MTNLQIYKILNRKYVLHNVSKVGKIIGGSAISCLAGVGASTVLSYFLPAGSIDSNTATIFGMGGLCIGVISAIYINILDYTDDSSIKLQKYEQIRKDLYNGINRFENVDKKDFQKILRVYPLPKTK